MQQSFFCSVAIIIIISTLIVVVPLPTVILGPTSTEHAQYFKDLSGDGGEMCANLTCLGKEWKTNVQD